jgi:hypothetical protein
MGSGNLFADLGLPDSGERQLRVQLALRLNDLLQAEGLTQAAIASHWVGDVTVWAAAQPDWLPKLIRCTARAAWSRYC